METKQIYIDKEALSTLGLLQNGVLSPVTKLMNEQEMMEVDRTKKYKGSTFPFAFLLAPSGRRNEEVLKNLTKGETVDLVCEGQICGSIKNAKTFKIDKDERVKQIYGTNNPEHPGVQDTYRRLGNYSIYGNLKITVDNIKKYKKKIKKIIEDNGYHKISALMLSGKPFHRVHERLIRTALVKNDFLVLFILKPFIDDCLPYKTRYKTIKYFCNNFIPKDKVIIVPLENTYIFGGFSELILNTIVAKNYGCNEIIVSKTKNRLGAFYEREEFNSILDTLEGIDINVDIMSDFVYCEMCSTLVSTNACPHGSHHHTHYHSHSIMELFKLGIMPPAILMRKEVSSIILSDMFPDRQIKLQQIHQRLFPNSGLLDDFETTDFYESLMKLYQTSSLT